MGLKIAIFTTLMDLHLLEMGAEPIFYKNKGYVIYKYNSTCGVIYITVPHFCRYIKTVFVRFETDPPFHIPLYNKETKELNFFCKRAMARTCVAEFEEWFKFLKVE